MTTKYAFKQCSLNLLEELFDVREIPNMPMLANWLTQKADISESEQQEIVDLQLELLENFRDWNETELAYNFIAPLIRLVNFSGENRKFFAERPLSAKFGNIELGGKVDGLIASGKRVPKQPYFCLHEYKKEEDPDGDPAGQVLAAMLVAQELNQHDQPVYGGYIKGSVWYFMVLQGLDYSISNLYAATREDIFEIFQILRTLKAMIAKMSIRQ
ncbi:MAG: hypothetical protein AAF639_09935 [Chloroflexota bacterium]